MGAATDAGFNSSSSSTQPADMQSGLSLSSRFSTASSTALLLRHRQDDHPDKQLMDKLYSRISWRLMSLFVVVMVLNHMDRTNLAYAALTMNADLGIGPATYGLGSALFFIPFCLCQIPSNLAVARVGVRRWLALLLLGWGTVATCMALIHNVPSFFTLRILLGVFEAGAVPAMWLHLACFFPAERLTKPFALLTVGILVAQAISGPIAAGFLAMDGLAGLQGWQWLFILEGLPTVVLSVVVWKYLPDSPAAVAWLTDSEKKLVESDLTKAANHASTGHSEACPGLEVPYYSQQQHLMKHGVLKLIRHALCNPWLLCLCVLGILLSAASNTYVFFLPMIIRALLTNGQLTPGAPGGGGGGAKLLPIVLTCIPYTLAAVTCWLVAHSSQKLKELYFHTAVPALLGGIFFVLFPILSQVSVSAGFASLVLVAISGACVFGPKTAIVHYISTGPSQLVAMPLYNSIVVLGGFVGPYITGQLVQKTGNFKNISILFGVMLMVVGASLILMKYAVLWFHYRQKAKMQAMRRDSNTDPQAPTAASGWASTGVNTAEEHVTVGPMTDVAAAGLAMGLVRTEHEQDAGVRSRAQVTSKQDNV